jgi:hypothetical protein
MLLVELRRTELLRAVQADDVAIELGLAPGATLRHLVAAAPEPWQTILDDHRRALLAATAEVAAASLPSGDARRSTPALEEAM